MNLWDGPLYTRGEKRTCCYIFAQLLLSKLHTLSTAVYPVIPATIALDLQNLIILNVPRVQNFLCTHGMSLEAPSKI